MDHCFSDNVLLLLFFLVGSPKILVFKNVTIIQLDDFFRCDNGCFALQLSLAADDSTELCILSSAFCHHMLVSY